MTDYYTQQSINRLASDSANQQAKINDIDAKIARLQAAADKLEALRTSAEDFSEWINVYDVGASWQGVKREAFEVRKSNTKSKADTHASNISQKLDSVRDEIRRLRENRSEAASRISSNSIAMSSLTRKRSYR